MTRHQHDMKTVRLFLTGLEGGCGPCRDVTTDAAMAAMARLVTEKARMDGWVGTTLYDNQAMALPVLQSVHAFTGKRDGLRHVLPRMADKDFANIGRGIPAGEMEQ